MQFELVSPERSLASLQVTEVQIPGADGDLTAMENHAPLVTTLRAGVLKVSGPEGAQEYAVTGGFAEIGADGTTVLAEKAVLAADMTQDMMADLISAASAAVENAKADAKDMVAKQYADLEALADALGLKA
ncbi:MAG: F0F1 ATP synthase subunit epsilon [Halocynthiibacter sp.]